ncbi:MAG TPA: homocysteine S-methyltransferase [Puia sp.]|nr:homocysteine S-methyltransferase [Puia sp.]
MENIFNKFLQQKRVIILDGAMATELEKRGADLNHPLWSAKILAEQPELIKQVHLDYLKSGADIITTASYQASFEGFAKYGYSEKEVVELMKLSTQLAVNARDEAIQKGIIKSPEPLIAASVGPYGAMLADGSEYKGNYGIDIKALKNFHRRRMQTLLESGADLLACETIPCADEAIALVELLAEFPHAQAWISFSCKDERHVSSGENFADCIRIVNQTVQVAAVGVNCTSPVYISSLLRIASTVTGKPLLVYPNKGETWDALHKCWLAGAGNNNFSEQALQWFNAGASLIGGCCRTTPEDIRSLKQIF